MYEFLVDLFSDEKPGVIEAFSLWHFIYLAIIITACVVTIKILKKKSPEVIENSLNKIIIVLLCVYILDFFVMPLSEGSVNTDKLPFHFCTMASILIAFSRFNPRIKRFRPAILSVSMTATTIYLVYPASAFGDAGALSYQVIQTLAYHGLLLLYCVTALFTGNVKLEMKKYIHSIFVILFVIAIAYVANYAYSDDLNNPYDWAFINGINFNIFSEENRRLMIFAVFGAFSLSSFIFYGIAHLVEKNKQNKVQVEEKIG